jgi:hypothetical protein
MATTVLLLTCAVAWAQSVSVHKGNIVLRDRDGATHRITGSGRDSEPSLSADGRQMVFIRGIREIPGIGVPRVTMSEIWMAEAGRRPEAKRLYAGPVMIPDGRSSAAFTTPKFSPDRRYIYFLSDFAATSAALCRPEVASGAARFLSAAVDYDVLQSGPHRGFIVASRRTLSERDGLGLQHYTHPYYLLTPDGTQLERVAGEEAQIEDVVTRLTR